ncbi:MAG TPA: DUF393 domain-containing protein [Candidatus Corynebacterium gallistercoris]|uniref:DUF393 domain-containing protein n=1 Tax=Candidatus Corynebacterium gallistercoris TaxID=2838530 RepID=A0A9D1UQG1_9CORY|nr:DUF393 domain-containing protein [Candidatus Corynebacterium gallistercoris]
MTSARGTAGEVFLYDRDCGFCEWCAEWLVRLAEVPVSPAAFEEYAVYRTPQAEFRGHRAIAEVLTDRGRSRGMRLVGWVLGVRALDPLWRRMYSVVARNRYKLGPLVGKDACSIG